MEKSFNSHPFIAGILLASGSSTRFGSPKQLIEWKGDFLINYVINEILNSQIDHLLVVLGDHFQEISKVVDQRPKIINNTNWKNGKSSSIKAGINQLDKNAQGVIFFVVDQPYITKEIINKLISENKKSPEQIIVPRIKERICNPVLFGRKYFPELINLTFEQGGKAIIEKSHLVKWVDWDDEKLLFDIDTQNDYKNLLEGHTTESSS